MKMPAKKLLYKLKKFFINPRLMLCLAVSWLITNGWAYAFVFIGTHLNIDWMPKIAAAYLAILWSPLCVEGILTIAISVLLLKIFFPDDRDTLSVLENLSEKYKIILKKKLLKLKKRFRRKNRK